MKTRIFCLLPFAFCLLPSAFADLTATVTPGYTLNSGETPTTSKLNRGFNPTITISGTIGGTNAGISAKSINGGHLTDSVAGTNNTISFDGNAPRGLMVTAQSISTNQLNSNAFAGTLQGGAGKPVTNRTDNTSILVNSSNQLAIATNAVVETGLTNTDYLLMFSTRTNAGGLGGGTNKVFELTTLLTLQAFFSNAIIPLTFTSSLTTLAAGKMIDAAHGYSNAPVFVQAVVVCQIADSSGYSTNDEVNVAAVYFENTDATPAFAAGANSTNVFLSLRAVTTLKLPVKTNGAYSTFTAGNWKAKIYARP